MSNLKHLSTTELKLEAKRSEHHIGQLTGKINNAQTRLHWVNHWLQKKINEQKPIILDESETIYVITATTESTTRIALFYVEGKDEADEMVRTLERARNREIGGSLDSSLLTDDEAEYITSNIYTSFEVDPVVLGVVR